MKLEKFKEKNNKRIGIIVFTIVCILLVSGAVLYRTFAVFEVKTNQNVIKGKVEDPGNIYFAFYQKSEDGNYEIKKDMPNKNEGYVLDEEQSYCGVNGEKSSNIKVSVNEDWKIIVSDVTTSRTKCTLYFKKGEKLIDILKSEFIQQDNSGKSGIYEVTHDDATITYTEDSIEISNLKQKELRYAGADPHNYVKLGNYLWRIIGLVNTPEGQRIKLVRDESIGFYSWDSSDLNVNSGSGVNEWSQADLMFELNYMYLSSQSGSCYSSTFNVTKNCDFSDIGLKNEIELIDTVTWNLGASSSFNLIVDADGAYNIEYSNVTGKNCSDGDLCNDNTTRSLTWKGKLALLSPADILYASVGSQNVLRSECMFVSTLRSNSVCSLNNYLVRKDIPSEWLLNPYDYGNTRTIDVSAMYYQSDSYPGVSLSTGSVYASVNVRPSFYLKENVLVKNGDGSKEKPYELAI